VALEREHKFLVAAFPEPSPLRSAFRAAGFELRAGRVRQQRDVYYDTPARTLLRSGAALRVRRVGTVVLATYKGRGEIKGSLHAREEVEVPYRAPWPPEILAKLRPLGVLGELAPLLTLTTRRTRYALLASGDAAPVAELTFDEVTGEAGGARCSFREIELEAHPATPDAVLTALALPLSRLGLEPHHGDKLTHALALLGLRDA
jgi:triphosphatase